ncbi:hypothetical protein [Streptomyces sp. NPDC002078]
MGAWLANAWDQTWPNLLANVLWLPAVGIHHWLTRRHLRALHHLIEKRQP